jgi:hypothetical protein
MENKLTIEAKNLIGWSTNLIKGPSKLNDELDMWLRVYDIYGDANVEDASRLLKWASNNVSRPSAYHQEVDMWLHIYNK